MQPATKHIYSTKNLLIIASLSIGYLLLCYVLIGIKQDQLTLVILFNLCYFLSSITRKLIIGLTVFIVFWMLFDFMKAFPNYQYNTVHIQSLYNAEKTLFGINSSNVTLTPNEYWLQHTTTFLNVITGIFYLSWVPVPIAFSIFLFFKNRVQFLHFSLTFLLVNIVGFIVYYCYPAAPPWYIQEHGFVFNAATKGSTAGLARFDAFFNTNTFAAIYAKGSNVFAAMPSLHAAYPLIVLFFGIKNKLGIANIFLAMLMVGIWFSAVYTSHHYVIDVLAGISCAIVGIGLFQWLVTKNNLVKMFVQWYYAKIK